MEERNKEESPLGEVKEGTQKVEGKPEGKMVKILLKKMLIRKMSKC